jgi:outer membrane protein
VVTSAFRYGAGNSSNGALLNLGATYSTAVAPNWRMGAGVSGTWANQAYMQSYFGVTSMPSRPPAATLRTTPSAGLRDLRASLSATYLMSPRMVITAAVSYDMLQGSAKDSPLSLQPNVFSGVVALTYGF